MIFFVVIMASVMKTVTKTTLLATVPKERLDLQVVIGEKRRGANSLVAVATGRKTITLIFLITVVSFHIY